MSDLHELNLTAQNERAHANGGGSPANLEVAQRYFDAWNRRDAAGIVALFAEGGTYSDPTTGGPLTGEAIGAYAAGLWSAFPDLTFDLVSVAPTADGMVAAQWVMRGTNSGSMFGLPPSGRSVSLPGADFIVIEDGSVRSVTGYFDSGILPRQLGLQVVVQPHQIGPFSFGTVARVHNGNDAKVGGFSLTYVEVNTDEDVEYMRTQSRQIATEMMAMHGFISFMGIIIGRRMYTISAWESVEDVRQLAQNNTHRTSVSHYYGHRMSTGGVLSAWRPEYVRALMRCTACGRVSDLEREAGRCPHCGEPLPAPAFYW